MMRGRTAAAPRGIPDAVPAQARPVARRRVPVASGDRAASPFFTFALALYASVTVARLHEVVPLLSHFYLGKVAVLILIAAFVKESSSIPFSQAFATRTAKCIGAMTVVGVLSVPTSYWPGQSVGFLRDTWPLIALLGIGLLVGMDNRVTAQRTIASVLIVAIIGAGELVVGAGAQQIAVAGNTVSAVVSERAYIAGGGSSTYDSNYSAAFFVMMIPYALMFAGRKGWMRWVGIFGVPILGMAMIKTGSRGGIVAMIVLAVCIIAFADKKTRPKQILILAVCVAAMLALPHNDLTQRIRALITGEDYNFDAKGGRWEVWSNGMQMLIMRPFLGVGMHAFPVADFSLGSGFMDAHNSYVQVAAELGIPGIVAFVMMIAAAFKSVWGMRRSSGAIVRSGQPNEQAAFDLALSTAALCALIAELTAAAFLSLGYEAMTMFALTVPIGLTLTRSRGASALVAAARNGAVRLRGMKPRGRPASPPQRPAPTS